LTATHGAWTIVLVIASIVATTTSASATSATAASSAGSLIFGLFFVVCCLLDFFLVLAFSFLFFSDLVLELFNLFQKLALAVFFEPSVFYANLRNLLVKFFSAHGWRDLDQTKLLNLNNIEVKNVLVLNLFLLLTLILFTTTNSCELLLLSIFFAAKIL
jgi:hypothetical protein